MKKSLRFRKALIAACVVKSVDNERARERRARDGAGGACASIIRRRARVATARAYSRSSLPPETIATPGNVQLLHDTKYQPVRTRVYVLQLCVVHEVKGAAGDDKLGWRGRAGDEMGNSCSSGQAHKDKDNVSQHSEE